MKSIKFKFISIFLILGLIPVIIVSVISTTTSIEDRTQIATAAEQQSVVVDEILQNIEVLNTGVTQSSQATDNMAESSVDLARLATELEKETSKFKI